MKFALLPQFRGQKLNTYMDYCEIINHPPKKFLGMSVFNRYEISQDLFEDVAKRHQNHFQTPNNAKLFLEGKGSPEVVISVGEGGIFKAPVASVKGAFNRGKKLAVNKIVSFIHNETGSFSNFNFFGRRPQKSSIVRAFFSKKLDSFDEVFALRKFQNCNQHFFGVNFRPKYTIKQDTLINSANKNQYVFEVPDNTKLAFEGKGSPVVVLSVGEGAVFKAPNAEFLQADNKGKLLLNRVLGLLSTEGNGHSKAKYALANKTSNDAKSSVAIVESNHTTHNAKSSVKLAGTNFTQGHAFSKVESVDYNYTKDEAISCIHTVNKGSETSGDATFVAKNTSGQMVLKGRGFAQIKNQIGDVSLEDGAACKIKRVVGNSFAPKGQNVRIKQLIGEKRPPLDEFKTSQIIANYSNSTLDGVLN